MPQPQPRIQRLALLADLEIELRAGAAAAVTGLSDGLTGGDLLTDGLVKAGVVAVEAHVAVAVIDDDEEPESGQPVRIDHPALRNRAHGGAALRREEVSLPLETAGPYLAEALDDAAGHGPGQLAAHSGEGRVAQILRRQTRGRPPQLAEQRFEVALLLPQAPEPLRTGLGLRGDAGQNLHAMRAGLLQSRDLRLLVPGQPRELRVLRLQLTVELPDPLQIALDGRDPGGPRPAEVAVIDEHAARPRRILLVEQQLERLLAADEVGSPQLPGERAAAAGEVGLELLLPGLELRPARGAGLPLLHEVLEGGLGLADRFLRVLQLTGELVPLCLAAAHLARDPCDLAADGLELCPGLAGIRDR